MSHNRSYSSISTNASGNGRILTVRDPASFFFSPGSRYTTPKNISLEQSFDKEVTLRATQVQPSLFQVHSPIKANITTRSISPINNPSNQKIVLNEENRIQHPIEPPDWERLFLLMKQEKNELREENSKLRNDNLVLVGQLEEQKFFLNEKDTLGLRKTELETDNKKLRSLLEECQMELSFWTKEKRFRLKELEQMTSNMKESLDVEQSDKRSLEIIVSEKNQEINNLRNYLNLKEKAVQDYEYQINRVRAENEGLQASLELLENDLRRWKEKFSDLEENHAYSVEQMKTKMDVTRRIMLDKETTQLNKKWSEELSILQNQMSNFKLQVIEADERSHLLEEFKKKLEAENEDLKAQLIGLRIQKEEAAELSERNLENFQISCKNQMQEILRKETEALTSDFNCEKNLLEKKICSLKTEITEKESQINLLQKESKDYKMIIENKEEEIKGCKANMERLERMHQRLIDEMNETHEYKLKIALDKEKRDSERRLNSETRSLYEKLKEHEERAVDHNKMLQVIKEENNIIKERCSQVEQEYEETLSRFEAAKEEWKNKLSWITSENQDLRQVIDEKGRLIIELDEKITRIQTDYNDNISAVNFKTEAIISEMQKSCEREKQNSSYKVKNITEEKISLEGQIRDLTQKLIYSENALKLTKEEVNYTKRQCHDLEDQLKTEMAEQLRKNQQELLERVSDHNNQLELLNSQKREIAREKDELERRLGTEREEVQRLRNSLDDHRDKQEHAKKSSLDKESAFNRQQNELKSHYEKIIEENRVTFENERTRIMREIESKARAQEESERKFQKTRVEYESTLEKIRTESDREKSLFLEREKQVAAANEERIQIIETRYTVKIEEATTTFNSKLDEMKSELEAMGQKFHQLEFENERLKIAKNQLEKQVEGVKKASLERETEFANEKDEIRRQGDRRTEERIDQEKKLFRSQLEIEKSGFQNDIRKAGVDIEDLKQTLRVKEEELRAKVGELEEHEQNISGLKLKLIESERKNQQDLLDQKSKFQAEKENLEREYKRSTEQIRADFESLKRDASMLKMNLEENKRRVEDLNGVINRKNEELKLKESEIEDLRITLDDELDGANEEVQRIKDERTEESLKFDAERANFRTQITQLLQTKAELESSNSLALEKQQGALGEYDRLRADILNLNKRIIEIQEKRDADVAVLRNELEKSRNDLLEFKTRELRGSGERSSLNSQIIQIQQEFSNKSAELENLYKLLNEKKRDNENHLLEIDGLKKQLSANGLQIANLEFNLMNRNTTINNLNIEIESYKKEKETLNELLKSYQKELMGNTVMVKDVVDQFESVKKNYEVSSKKEDDQGIRKKSYTMRKSQASTIIESISIPSQRSSVGFLNVPSHK